MSACPIPSTHRRLEEAHRLWYRAAASYDDLPEFRANLNALIQALRNVTFVLQKEQSGSEGFDEWYEWWRELMKQDVALAWSVGARNRVVKEGDLEINSTAIAGVQASWDEPEVISFEVPPKTPTLAIVRSLAEQELPGDVREQGLLRVERRWVATDLPQSELLHALAHCYEILTFLVADAHRRNGSSFSSCDVGGDREPDDPSLRTGRPAGMNSETFRTVTLNLRTNAVVQLAPHVVPRNNADVDAKTRERYGKIKLEPPRRFDVFELARSYMAYARQVLALDGFHLSYAMLFLGPVQVGLMAMMPEDQQSKMMLMKEVAAEVKATGATSVIFIADAWYVTDPSQLEPGKRVGDSAARKEALVITATTESGGTLELFSPYSRHGDEIRFDGDPREGLGVPLFMCPVLQVWGLPVPSERDELLQLGIEAKSPTGIADAGPS